MMLVSSATMTTESDTHRAITSVWKIEQSRLIAGLTRMVRDISLAEELAQDALIIALKTWPESGVPRNPGAWLMQTAKRRAIDYFRHRKMAATKLEEVGRIIEDDAPDHEADIIEGLDDDVGDDLLKLIFTSCHPVLSPEARVALTLRLIGGLTTDEIARAFLAARHFERNAGIGNGLLGPHDALADGRLGGKERAGDFLGGEPAQQAQRQRDP